MAFWYRREEFVFAYFSIADCPCQRLPYPETSKSFKLAQSGCRTVWARRPSVLPAERI
ncbi:phenylacetic acid degradation protein PaaD [Neisseria flavescens]|nr:phenylacetic acid degradation protein PaaD [Neisseria flavescens]